jgi:drug/metabolite transporter (DMT)-like permease
LGLLATLATAFAFLMSIEVMKHLSPFTTAVAINLEPVYAIVLAALIFGDEERMHGGFYLGASIIVGAVFVDAFLKRRARAAKP